MYIEQKQPVCRYCGSTDIYADAYAIWNVDTQEWELSQMFDEACCGNCEEFGIMEWKEVPA